MTFRDTAGLALRNLGQAKLRTSLTTLGVSIGIASLAGMVSLGVGLQDQFVERFTRSGMFDAITVLAGGDLPGPLAGGGGRGRGGGFGRRGAGRGPQAPENARDITDAALAELAALPGVKAVYPSLRGPVEVKFRGASEYTQAVGVPMAVRGEGAFQSIPHGRFFTSDTEDACMLSLDYAKRIDEQNPGGLVGQTLTLGYAIASRGEPGVPPAGIPIPGGPITAGGAGISVQRTEVQCPVVGIVERETGPFAAGGGASGLMLPIGKAKAIYEGSPVVAAALLRDPARKSITYNSAVVRVTAARSTQDVEEAIKKMGFSAFSLNDALQNAKRGFIILDIVLSLIGSIALAVSSLGIMNTMVMSILERTREIGIMKAIGGSDSDIRRIFLIEASAIGLFGGVAGVSLGWLVGRVINFGANVYIQQQGGTAGNLFSLPFWLIGGAIGFSIAVSLVAGSYPAARAARLNPIEALRHD
jgi:putative ABC transport system permease protein